MTTENIGVSVGLQNVQEGNHSVAGGIVATTKIGRQVKEIDISNLTSEYWVKLFSTKYNQLIVYNIWLEK